MPQELANIEIEMARSTGSLVSTVNSMTPSQLDVAIVDMLHMAPDRFFGLCQGKNHAIE